MRRKKRWRGDFERSNRRLSNLDQGRRLNTRVSPYTLYAYSRAVQVPKDSFSHAALALPQVAPDGCDNLANRAVGHVMMV